MEREVEEIVKEMIFSSPLPLLSIKDKEVIDYINNFLPYSTGFEIECNKGTHFNDENFKNIPDIINVNCDSAEQRFRVPNGLKGIICLYNICEQLKLNSEENPLSGIHYHIDMTDVDGKLPTKDYIENNTEWILEELDKWGYKGKYNQRGIQLGKGSWLGFRGKTAEFRCGEMSFEYTELVRRIVHANNIIKRVKSYIKDVTPIYEPLDYEKVLNFVIRTSKSINENLLDDLNKELDDLNKEKIQDFKANESYKEIINKRIIKI